MDTFRVGHAIADTWNQAADTCLAQLGGWGVQGSLGFLYVADVWANDLGRIVAHLRAYTAVEHWVGTVGVGVCAADREYMDVPAMGVMVGQFPEGAFRVFHSAEDADLALHRDWRARQDARFAVVHGDPTSAQVPEHLMRLAHYLDGGFLVGGITSSRQNSLQVADTLARGGLSGVMFASTVPVATGLTQGCSPIGPIHEVTQGQRNILMELDGRPALEVFYQDIGEILARDLNRVAGYIFAGLPIHASDTGDYLVRNLVGVDPNRGWLAIGEIIEPGGRVMFCRRDARTAQQDMMRMLQQLKRRANGRAKAGLYFSCLGRGSGLFGENREIQMIQEVLGDLPLVGFYANGEISHNRLYGYTGVLSLFL
jgi:small ligand-binding sensory domain FIST